MSGIRNISEGGFTLVEMLVALSIFAVLAAAGVGLLRASVDTQNAVAERLSGSGSLARLHALLANDLAHVVAPPEPVSMGASPAFVGVSSGFTLLRSGWDNPDGAARSDVQQVEWTFNGGALARTGQATMAAPGQRGRVIAASQVRFRYRTASGLWSDSFTGSLQEPMPQAVELVLNANSRPDVTIVVALPPRGIDGVPVKPAELAPAA